MQVAQTDSQQRSKSKGDGGAGGDESDALDHASTLHGIARVGSAFDIMEVVSEYRALRASVLRLWRESNPSPDANDLDDITRFNEAIDQSLAKAVSAYTQRVNRSRQMFLAILGHDLRNPLAAVRMTARVMGRKTHDPDCVRTSSLIETQAQAVVRLVNDLIDFTSTGVGSSIPITCSPVDLRTLCSEMIESFRLQHPTRTFHLQAAGEVVGQWDGGRIRQVVSNLVGNAIQHGAPDGPILLSTGMDGDVVVLSVHNHGDPIPSDVLPTLFDPLVRHTTPASSAHRREGSIGLGLYIVREIAAAHGGSVDVTSTADDGTTFLVRIPREAK
jgi:hypothetical protein